MKTIITLCISILCITLLASCTAFQQTVDSNTTVFYANDFKVEGSISVVAANKKVSRSLEFDYYRKKFEEKLAKGGYQIEQDATKAKYLALVAYGIDNGKTAVVSTPIFGQISSGYYVRDQYIMPSYGVVDVINKQVTSFNRAIAMNIVLAESMQSGKVITVYESRTSSVGGCPVMVEVFDEMLEAMFRGFPENRLHNRKDSVVAVITC